MNKFGCIQRLAGLCAVVALATSIANAAPQTGSAKVTSVKGSATFGGKPASVGDVGGPGTVITTGVGSEVTLYLGVNGPDAKVLENSSLSLDDLTFDDAGSEPVVSTKLGLSKGKIEAYVRKSSSQSSYIVQTPTTTASIRGTTFTVYGDGTVIVWDGCVDVTYRDPATGREVKFNVCKGNMFDPRIPGIVETPKDITPPVVGSTSSVQPPVGPVVFVSPIAGSAGSSSGQPGSGGDAGGAKK